jgi:hypothetical protein
MGLKKKRRTHMMSSRVDLYLEGRLVCHKSEIEKEAPPNTHSLRVTRGDRGVGCLRIWLMACLRRKTSDLSGVESRISKQLTRAADCLREWAPRRVSQIRDLHDRIVLRRGSGLVGTRKMRETQVNEILARPLLMEMARGSLRWNTKRTRWIRVLAQRISLFGNGAGKEQAAQKTLIGPSLALSDRGLL